MYCDETSMSCEASKYLFLLTMYKAGYVCTSLCWQILITFNKGANYFFSSICLNSISFDVYGKWASRHEAVLLPTKMILSEKGIVCSMIMGSTGQANCEWAWRLNISLSLEMVSIYEADAGRQYRVRGRLYFSFALSLVQSVVKKLW